VQGILVEEFDATYLQNVKTGRLDEEKIGISKPVETEVKGNPKGRPQNRSEGQ
jgi:hypothetical protein